MTRATRRAGFLVSLALLSSAGCNADAVVVAVQSDQAPSLSPADVAPTPSLAVQAAGKPSFAAPLVLTATRGTLTSAVVTGPQGAVAGAVGPTGWTSTGALLPASAYRVAAQVLDQAGTEHTLALTTTTTEASHELTAVLTPGDDAVVGVGTPLTVLLNRPVKDMADQLAVLARLTVTTSPAVAGAWRFMSGTEIHYRQAAYWQPGTIVTLTSDLSYLQLADQLTWGAVGMHTTTYRIGAAMVSTVDIAAHTMTVRRDGQVLRVLKMSAGSPEYPTKGGAHIVLAKARVQLFDSATVGIPRNSAEGYYKKLPWSVRISNGGAFVHAQPGSVASQGIRNVSHGCINLNVSDAEWFFHLSRPGDVVDVVNAVVPPTLSDPGMSDWNIAYSDWAQPLLAYLEAAPGQVTRY